MLSQSLQPGADQSVDQDPDQQPWYRANPGDQDRPEHHQPKVHGGVEHVYGFYHPER